MGHVKVYPHPVELLSLFPTLASLARIAAPPSTMGLQGVDLTEAMRTGRPTSAGGVAAAAYSQITRCFNCSLAYRTDDTTYQKGCDKDSVDSGRFTVPCALTPATRYDWMGMSVRTQRWRYTIWCKWRGSALAADWSQCKLPELYNHTSDASLFDVQTPAFFRNVAGEPAAASTQSQLHALLRKGFP